MDFTATAEEVPGNLERLFNEFGQWFCHKNMNTPGGAPFLHRLHCLFDFGGELKVVAAKAVVDLAFGFVRSEVPDEGGFAASFRKRSLVILHYAALGG